MYSNRILSQFNRTVETAKALRGEFQKFRCFHYSCLYRGKRLISASYNLNKTHAKALRYYPLWTAEKSTHSEFSVLLKSGQETFEDFVLFCVRINNSGNVDYSRPCKFCEKVIKTVNVGSIFYSGFNGEIIQL